MMARFFLLFLVITFSIVANASEIIISENHDGYRVPAMLNGESSDKLLIPAPFSSGFSQVSLDKFNLNKPLQIINAASLNSGLAKESEATVIVLELSSNVIGVEEINLTSQIELIGKPADLVILSRGSNISCTGCTFKGFSRVTISTGIYYSATSSLADPMSIDESNFHLYLDEALDVNNANPDSGLSLLTQSGNLDISSLNAEGVVFLDLIAANVNLRGDIRTNLKGLSSSNGTFAISPIGDKEISSGRIQVHGGKTYLNYFNNSVYKKDTSVLSYIYSSAKVAAGSLGVYNHYSSGTIAFHGAFISTRGDYSLLNLYKGNNIVTDGAINLNTLGDVEVDISNIEFETELAINANSLKVSSTSKIGIESRGVQNISLAGVFLNYGLFSGDVLKLAASDVENEGEVIFNDDLYIKSSKNVINSYGGVLYAGQILIEAGDEIINGSYYPFRLNLPKFPVMYGISSVPEVDPYETGFYYNNLTDKLPDNVATFPATTLAATILGGNIELVAGTIININPYYLLNDTYIPDMEGSLDPILSDQVVVSANNNLTLRANNVYNVSAIVESAGGELAIIANNIRNERYRVRVDTFPGNDLPQDFCSQFDGCVTQSNTENVITDNLIQYAQYYSPAGRLYSGSRALFFASTRMLNGLGFIEVFGDLDMNVNDFVQLGYAYNNVININIVTHHKKRVCKNRVAGKCTNRTDVRWTTEEPHQENFVLGQIPVIFSVSGFVSGIGEGSLEVYTEDYLSAYAPPLQSTPPSDGGGFKIPAL